MFLFALATVGAAHADVEYVICTLDAFTDVRPASGQDDVPIDSRFIAVVDRGDCGAGIVDWQLFSGSDGTAGSRASAVDHVGRSSGRRAAAEIRP